MKKKLPLKPHFGENGRIASMPGAVYSDDFRLEVMKFEEEALSSGQNPDSVKLVIATKLRPDLEGRIGELRSQGKTAEEIFSIVDFESAAEKSGVRLQY